MPEPTTAATTELARFPLAGVQDVLVARLVVREQSLRMGFPPQCVTQIATAVSEITRNVVQHAEAFGQLRIAEIYEGGRRGLKVTVTDDGIGIPDVGAAMAGVAPGAGIPGSRRLMDQFGIDSARGKGTIVTMTKWLPSGCADKNV